jgi:hypothetical protein
MARHKVYYKGEGDGFPQVQAVVSFVSHVCPSNPSHGESCESVFAHQIRTVMIFMSSCLPAAHPCTKNAQTTH